MFKNLFTKTKNFLETDTGKLVLGIIAMIIAGVVTAKVVKDKE